MNEKYIFIDIIHLHYIFHSCTVSENNGNLIWLLNSYLPFCFLLFAFSMTTLLQLGVYLNWSIDKFTKLSKVRKDSSKYFPKFKISATL